MIRKLFLIFVCMWLLCGCASAAPNTHVLYFDSADLDAANTDKIMIVVNQV